MATKQREVERTDMMKTLFFPRAHISSDISSPSALSILANMASRSCDERHIVLYMYMYVCLYVPLSFRTVGCEDAPVHQEQWTGIA